MADDNAPDDIGTAFSVRHGWIFFHRVGIDAEGNADAIHGDLVGLELPLRHVWRGAA